MWPTKKKPSVFQAILQVDKETYNYLISCGSIFVGYDYCAVYDAINVDRCFNCNAFGHSSRVCKSTLACPRCSENHRVADCKSDVLKCSNCSVKTGTNITNHAAWDLSCPTFIAQQKKIVHNILSQ